MRGIVNLQWRVRKYVVEDEQGKKRWQSRGSGSNIIYVYVLCG
jgi:hypothetical protein